MSASSQNLQAAIFDTLATALPSLPVYDPVPPNAVFPYASFGAGTVRDRGGVEAQLDEHTLFLSVWSRSESRAIAADLAGYVRTALDGANLTLTDHHAVSLTVEQIDITQTPASGVYRAQLRLRAATEPTT